MLLKATYSRHNNNRRQTMAIVIQRDKGKRQKINEQHQAVQEHERTSENPVISASQLRRSASQHDAHDADDDDVAEQAHDVGGDAEPRHHQHSTGKPDRNANDDPECERGM